MFSKTNSKLNVEKTSNFSIYNPVVECLVVGGGGGGGSWYAGGGGAGGLVYSQNLNFERTQVYTITVGLGGAGRPSTVAGPNATDAYGSKGENSSVVGQGINIIAYGGGGGPGYNSAYRADIMEGGSGAGGRPNNYAGTVAAVGVGGQGNSGGVGDPSGSTDKGGGGGGAGGVGTNGASGGHGGLGLQYSITGIANYYAGGGGGGAGNVVNVQNNGGSGVGGNGRSNADGKDGVINTGSGGGGSTSLSTDNGGKGGNGGSGIVVLSTEKTAVSYTGSPVISKNNTFNVYSFLNSGTITF